ncbi:MAG: DNA mismatch endonuclease Vsr [Pseudomonadota bacterium]
MVDVVDQATRSRMMAGIRGKDTKPEIILRKALHRAGFRFRLHAKDLPGRPDVVLSSRRVVVFVQGCFWHRHAGCHWCSTPASNFEFWEAKFARNVERDRNTVQVLSEMGWRTAVVWECGLRKTLAASTVEHLIRWMMSDSVLFESGLVRPKEVGIVKST